MVVMMSSQAADNANMTFPGSFWAIFLIKSVSAQLTSLGRTDSFSVSLSRSDEIKQAFVFNCFKYDLATLIILFIC